MNDNRTSQSKRAAVYPRVSSKLQEDNYSIDTQLAACMKHATDLGYEVDPRHVYREIHTGVDFWERPKMTELRESIRAGEIDAVVFYSVDRYARDPIFHMLGLAEARQYGVTFHIVTEDLDLSDDDDVLMFFLRGYSAKREWRDLKERSQRGRKARVMAGKPLPSSRPLYGYQWVDNEKTRLEFNPETSIIARRIFVEAASGVSIRGIARALTRDGIPTPSGKSNKWDASSISQMLRNRAYKGEAYGWGWRPGSGSQGGRAFDIENAIPLPEGTVPPLIDDETWEAVQSIVARNKQRASRNNRYPEAALLRGGYAVCGYCGRTLHVQPEKHGGLIYRCSAGTRNETGCGRHAMKVDNLDAAVWGRIHNVLTKPDVIHDELSRLQRDDPTDADVELLDKALADIQRKKQRAAKNLTLFDDEEDAAPLVREIKRLREQEESYQCERETLIARRAQWEQAQEHVSQIVQWCSRVASRLDELTYQQKRMALEALGVKVKLYRHNHDPRYVIEANVRIDNSPVAPENIVLTAT
jgi:site-specific DNA recombinase